MAEVVGLARAGRWDEADALWMEIYDDWWDDPRFQAVSAQLGLLAGNLEATASDLERVANDDPVAIDGLTRRLWSGELNHELALELAAAHPNDWREMVRTALLLEQRYYVLLWQGRLDEAREYAVARTQQARRLGIPGALWLERQGDAEFWSGDVEAALRAYEGCLEEHPNPRSVYLKLSDVHYRLGDVERERYYREAIYGRLEETSTAP
jgi:tetratricopeptide (TPR) repeat protein